VVSWSVDWYKNKKDTVVYIQKGETIHKIIQKHRIHKIEHKNTKQITNIKKNI